MDNPQFTIVTPSYNYAKYIRESLDSVKAQAEVTYEHLVFDAGSSDGTLDILRGYRGIDLTVEPDKGMSDAINKGFKKARGEWVMWLNSDDRLLPGALKSVADFSAKHPEADVIHGAWNFIDATGRIKRSMKAVPFSLGIVVEQGCYIASTATFFRRRSTILEGFLLNDNFQYVMDGEYFARLGRAGKKFVSLNVPLADFRQHEDALSANNYGYHAKDGIDVCLHHCKRFAETMAIRRAYGLSPFQTLRWNLALDAVLFEVFRLKKGILKLFLKSPKNGRTET